ncbi:helix-turn-helix domain-containing protein [Cytophagaceae bacterium DM2B3-1]|uniref:Helix-turn-helix domain-containing protein n=1 Tax=Xanthocytophaga flava TaxID=3048013 RepID=A0ABT7CS04_9BACT|nr:helix-turn-helix domain-containing protein [Xanthocytophaga flavus]MDJ1468685.1 helix-turn-helix domain-containing protein [Xanthocytophaga flavus]MDJ1496466.1 helix-turn-helix domain-containing protein [Xanthocytophaga flavus]
MHNPFDDLQDRLIRLEALVLELHSYCQPSPAHLGGIELAMQITGLAQSTIYNLVSADRIPYMKRGKKLYFSRTDLEAWIMDGKQDVS